MTEQENPVLDRSAVAALLGVKPKTISQYLVESHGEGRYSRHPFPKPDGYIGRGPWWRRERAPEIHAWSASRPGQGAGGGRPLKLSGS